MTNAIGTGTRNLSANVPVDEWEILVAWGKAKGGLGNLVRHLVLSGAQADCPVIAKKIQAVRRRYYGLATMLFVLGLFLSGDLQARLARRLVRGRRNEFEECEFPSGTPEGLGLHCPRLLATQHCSAMSPADSRRDSRDGSEVLGLIPRRWERPQLDRENLLVVQRVKRTGHRKSLPAGSRFGILEEAV